MQRVHRENEVTVHLKLPREIRQKAIGNLRYQGLTLQDFFEDLMTALAADPARIADIQALAAERSRRTAAATP